jgi:hypothetical protein
MKFSVGQNGNNYLWYQVAPIDAGMTCITATSTLMEVGSSPQTLLNSFEITRKDGVLDKLFTVFLKIPHNIFGLKFIEFSNHIHMLSEGSFQLLPVILICADYVVSYYFISGTHL